MTERFSTIGEQAVQFSEQLSRRKHVLYTHRVLVRRGMQDMPVSGKKDAFLAMTPERTRVGSLALRLRYKIEKVLTREKGERYAKLDNAVDLDFTMRQRGSSVLIYDYKESDSSKN